MVTGAAGRRLLLESVYGLPAGRATEDIDLGVMVASWEQYQTLVARICQDTAFQPDHKQRQRLRYRHEGLLDLVPFGGIENKDRMIRWPPDDDFAMSVMGFSEVRAQAIEMDVDGLVVPVVSPAGLVLLKLVAWKQRRHIQPRKDAADIAYVLRHFSAVVTTEVMFEKHLAAIEGADYDMEVAACRVLGQEMAVMAATDSLAFIKQLLDDELRDDGMSYGDYVEQLTYLLFLKMADERTRPGARVDSRSAFVARP
jgi:predicted nucleotidyltransferase